MRIAFFSAKAYDRSVFDAVNRGRHVITYFDSHLDVHTAALARGFDSVCVFVNDCVRAEVVEALAASGVRLIALRCAGFNNVDLAASEKSGTAIVRVPAYSPYAVAEHAVGLILALNRRIHRAYNRVREGNFALDGLVGFDLHGRTVGVIGTGKIGAVFARIMLGFGCRVLAYDVFENPECAAAGVRYSSMADVLRESDILSLHCPLTPETHHLIDHDSIEQMKRGVMLINTSRGALVNTQAVIHGLKTGVIGYLALDVYEEEADLFFEDLSGQVIQDDTFARLLTFPNVLITGHQAFFTEDALKNIAETTLANVTEFETTGHCANRVTAQKYSARA